jgi:hypothetical protein
MFKAKLITSTFIFILFLIIISIIKNKTRIIEKEISKLNLEIASKEKDINETQLEYFYLTSPAQIEKRLKIIGFNEYQPIRQSKIYFNVFDFVNLEKKISKLGVSNEKKK